MGMKTAKIRKRRLLLLIPVAAFFVLLAMLTAIVVVDAEAPDDSHMVVIEADVPPAKNGYALYERAVTKIVANDKGWILHDLTDLGAGDLSFVECLRENQEALAFYDAALSRETFVPPVPGPSGSVVGITDAANIVRLAVTRLRALALLGSHERALSESTKLLRFVSSFQETSDMITLMVMMSNKRTCLHEIRNLARTGSVPADRIRELQQRVVTHSITDTQISNILRRSYWWHRSIIAELEEYSLSERIGEIDEPSDVGYLLFKPNMTRRVLLGDFEMFIEDVSRPERDFRSERILRSRCESSVAWAFLKGNVAGEGFLRHMYGVPSFLGSVNEVRYFERATEVALAVCRFMSDCDRPPETLEDLVPEYLDAVPIDPYDHEPLRYCPEERVITYGGVADNEVIRPHYRVPVGMP